MADLLLLHIIISPSSFIYLIFYLMLKYAKLAMHVPSRKFALGTACVLDLMGEHVIKARDCQWISSVDVNTYILKI